MYQMNFTDSYDVFKETYFQLTYLALPGFFSVFVFFFFPFLVISVLVDRLEIINIVKILMNIIFLLAYTVQIINCFFIFMRKNCSYLLRHFRFN